MREIMEPLKVNNDNLIQSIERSIEKNDKNFGGLIAEIKDLNATKRAAHVRWDAAIAEMGASVPTMQTFTPWLRKCVPCAPA